MSEVKTTKALKKETGKLLPKLLTLLLAYAFLSSGIAFAAPQQDMTIAAVKEAVTNPDNIVIPREYGLVKSKFNANSGRLVINVLDVHCNYEAQSNIAKILEGLVKNYGLSFAAVEGAAGTVDMSWFRLFKDDAVRKEVADYFMKKGEISGPEFLSVTAGYPIKLFGVETRLHYLQNLNALTSSYPFKDETEKHLNNIKSALDNLKNFIYSDELKKLDAESRGYESKSIQLNDYIRFLQAEAEKNRIDLIGHENLFKLVNVLACEKKIDFNVTGKERTALIDELSKKLSKEAIIELVTQSMLFKLGRTSSVEYYTYLTDLAANIGIDISKNYPNLDNYIAYNSVYSTIDSEELLREMKVTEAAIKERLFNNDDQRTLDKLSRHVDILFGLVNIRLLNSDFDYYEAHRDEFANNAFTDFIVKKSARYGLVYTVEPPTDAVAKSISKLEDFYTIAIKRDKVFVYNMLNMMKREGQRSTVLVAGGFHSEGIVKLLKEEGISYMVVSPSITKDAPTPYIQVLTNPKASPEEVVIGAIRE